MRAIDGDALKRRAQKVATESWKMKIEAKVETVLNQFIDWIDEAPTIQTEPHWIPVTENTLPEENRVVVVCGDKGTWDFGTYRGHGDNIHYWHWKKNTYKRVYWWMYKEDALPKPFKGVTE